MSGVKRLELTKAQEHGEKGSQVYNPCGVKKAKAKAKRR